MKELRIQTAILVLALFALASACGQQSQTDTNAKNTDTATEQESAQQTESETPVETAIETAAETNTDSHSQTEAAKETLTKNPTKKPTKKPSEAKTTTVEIPAGMNIVIALNEAIETGKINTGDAFGGTLVDSIVINGKEIFPSGSQVTGTVLNAVGSGRLKTDAELSLTLTQVGDVDVQTDVIEDKASSHKDRNKKLIGGGAIVGGILGAIKGKNVKGAIVGAAAGAAAGTGAAALTGKQNLRYDSGTLLQFTLTESAKAPVKK